jgi:hypothetical protein
MWKYITTDFKAIDSQETIATVKDFFIELNYSHFPVLEEGVSLAVLPLKISKLSIMIRK